MKHTTFVLASLLSAAPAAADAVIAVRDDSTDKVSVYKIGSTGLTKVVTDPGDVADFGWSDAKTLWVRYHSDTETLLGKIVDGKIEKLKIDPGPLKVAKDNTLGLTLRTTKAGQVWIQYCLQAGDLDCNKSTWLRVDLPKQKQATRGPAGLGPANPPVFPAVATPKGFKVALQQVVVDGLGDDQKKMKTKGAICTGPSGSKTWPDNTVDIPFAMKPSKVTWVRAEPPIAKIEGKATNPIGQIEEEEAVFVGCKDVYDQVTFFGGGAWGIRKDGDWQIYVDAKQVAKLSGRNILPAPTK